MSRLPRRLVASCLLGVLAACQAPATTPPASTRKASPAATTTTSATATPKAAAASATPARPALLQASTGGQRLAGKVELEPAYLLATKKGSLITNDGGSILAVGDTLISQDGAGLISQDGGGLVAQGGGNVVAPANLISQDGGGLISQDGAGLVASGGGNAVAPAFRLLQAETLTRDYAPVPAAGAAVYLRSLTDGKALPLGQDADGKPAYALYTNLKGEFELWVPEAQRQTVEVVAFMPGAGQDSRQRYHLLTKPDTAAPVQVDDDTSAVATYVRAAFQTAMLPVIAGDRAASEVRLKGAMSVPEFRTVLEHYLDAAFKAGLRERPLAEREAIATAITDRVLAHIDLSAAKVNLKLVQPGNTYKPISEDAVALLADMLRERREEVARVFAALKQGDKDPVEVFSTSPTITRFSKRDLDAGLIKQPYRIEYPTDFGTFLAVAIIGRGTGDDVNGSAMTLGTYETEVGMHINPDRGWWFMAALSGISNQLGAAFFFHEDEILPLFEGR